MSEKALISRTSFFWFFRGVIISLCVLSKT
jgi:hypothetical protein